MLIDFAPALANTLHVSVPSAHKVAVLGFTAGLSAGVYKHLNQSGAKLQLWSNIPFDGFNAARGEWTQADFQEHKEVGNDSAEISLGVVVGPEEKIIGPDSQWEGIMSLQLSIPLASALSRFEFTYRIIYPSGEIKWLGRFGPAGNGVLVLDHSKADPTLVLSEGWSVGDAGSVWATQGRPADGVEVLRLAIPSDYTVWTLGGQK